MSQFTMRGVQGASERPLSDRYQEGYPTKLDMPEEEVSITGEQLSTIVNRIADIRGVSQSLFKRLSPILVPTPETTAVKEPRTTAPTKLGQGLDDIIDQLGGVLDYLRELTETVRL